MPEPSLYAPNRSTDEPLNKSRRPKPHPSLRPRPRLLSQKPSVARHAVPNGLVLTLSGNWSLDEGPDVEHCIEEIVQAGAGRRHLVLDLALVRRLDTLGAWAVVRVRPELGERECSVVLDGRKSEHRVLLTEVARHKIEPTHDRETNRSFDTLVAIGKATVGVNFGFV